MGASETFDEDFGAAAVDLAGRILENLGIGQDASREPGADRRRDRIAAMIHRSLDAEASDLSSLRKGAEVAAIMEMFGRWQTGYAFDDDNDDDVDLEARVEGEIAALVSGSREEQA